MFKALASVIISLLLSSLTFAQIKVCGKQLGVNSCQQGDERFIAKGVDYQPEENVDPLTDDKLDYIKSVFIPSLKEMGANVIRVYQVCPGGSCQPHKKVMDALKSENIYVMVGLADYKDGTKCTVDRSTGNYPQTLKDCYQSKIDEFAQFDNVLGFSVSNEAWDIPDNIDDNYLRPSSTIKALIRDMKAYIKEKNYDKPVGAVLRDVPDVTIPMAYYYACHLTGEDKEQDTSADFIGYNVYRWGEGIHSGNYPSLLNKYSKYQLVKLGNDGDTQKNGFKSINIPVILTEFGRVDNPRLFAQVDWMFSAGAPITSGGMVFRVIQRPTEAEFGLYQTTKMTTPTTNGGLDNLIREYTEKKPLKLDTGVDTSKNICDASLFPGIDNFELNPEKLPSAGSGSEGTHDLSFNSGDLQLPLDDLSINYQDNSGWHNAAIEKNVTSKSNFQTKIPNPSNLQAIGVNFNGTNGACIVKPGSLLCKSEDCKELKVISAKWSSNGQGSCTLE